MLILVLLLILVAAGVLVAAVVTAHPQWAWISVVLSVVGALMLVLARGRRRRSGGDRGDDSAAAVASTDGHGDSTDEESEGAAESTTVLGVTGAGAADEGPAEEDADAADALMVSDLDDTVVVLDEYPRYHLEECSWVGDGETIPLPVSEARELGFTPCSRCSPDSTLAERKRSSG